VHVLLKRKFALFYVLIMSLCLAAFALILFHGLGYRVNRSASLPFFVYKIAPFIQDTEVERGNCVLIDLSKLFNPVIDSGVERGYVNLREPMLKRIGAIPGDTVVLMDGFLFINGKATKVTVASHDSYGGKLSMWPDLRFSVATPLVLQPGEYWLVSDPERGFDSRYFGPVSESTFTHKARPVFHFSN